MTAFLQPPNLQSAVRGAMPQRAFDGRARPSGGGWVARAGAGRSRSAPRTGRCGVRKERSLGLGHVDHGLGIYT